MPAIFDSIPANSKDSIQIYIGLFLLLSLVFTLLLTFIQISPSLESLVLTKNVILLLFLLLISALPFFSAMSSNAKPVNEWVNGFGEGKTAIWGLIAGAIVGALFIFLSSHVNNPSPTILDSIFVKFGSPVIEELFFRGFMLPTFIWFARQMPVPKFLALIGLPELFAIVLESGIFALYHLGVYGGDPSALAGSFLFAIILSLGVYLTRSLGFGIGAHIVVNTFLTR
jgi:membrane protease YdiL (CAAX protease family)